MTLLSIDKFGGICPKIVDPALLAPNKSMTAQNCRFDRGGVTPLQTELFVETLGTTEIIQSIFAYWAATNDIFQYFLAWDSDVDAVTSPVPNDAYDRVYFTEGGILKVTDKDIFTGGLLQADIYPMGWLYPSPPAPELTINAAKQQLETDLNLVVDSGSCSAQGSDGSHPASDVINDADSPDPAQYWKSASGFPTWWQYDLTTSAIVNWLSITYGTNVGNYGPKRIIVLGSNDASFANGTYTSLYDSGSIDLTWTPELQTQVFTWTNLVSFRYIRIYFQSNTELTYPVAAIANQIQIKAITPLDPTLTETRGYVYTFVNGYGDEGPPSSISNLVDVFDGDVVELAGMDTATTSIVLANATYNITKKRIYRINQTAGGSAQFQFLAEIEIEDSTFTDNILNSALAEVLATIEWDPAPDALNVPGNYFEGLISLPNGVLAGFTGNIVCFSVPFYPHAWPVRYQKATDRKVVGLGSYGTTVVALTEGQPYIIVGNDPGNTVMEKLDLGLSCLSKRGIVHIGSIIMYPSPEGLVGIASSGIDLLTGDILTDKQWNSIYNPSTISGYYWEGKYIGFYTSVGGVEAGFMFDLKTRDLVDLDCYATAGYHDPTDGKLYLVFDEGQPNIYSFSEGVSYKSSNYYSKRYKFPKTSFGVLKILSDSYPVQIDIIYPKLSITDSKSVVSENFHRIPKRFVDTCEVQVTGSSEVSVMYLAGVPEELPI